MKDLNIKKKQHNFVLQINCRGMRLDGRKEMVVIQADGNEA